MTSRPPCWCQLHCCFNCRTSPSTFIGILHFLCNFMYDIYSRSNHNSLALEFRLVDMKALLSLLIFGRSFDFSLLERLPKVVILLLLESVVLLSSLPKSGKKSSSIIGPFMFACMASLFEII